MSNQVSTSIFTVVTSRLRDIFRVSRTTPEVTITLFVLVVISMGGFMFHPTHRIDDEPDPVTGSSTRHTMFPYLLLAISYVASFTW